MIDEFIKKIITIIDIDLMIDSTECVKYTFFDKRIR